MPDREWVLLNPGPANTSPRVRQALLTPDLCHREPEFFEVMRDWRERLVRLADARDAFTAVLRGRDGATGKCVWGEMRLVRGEAA